MKTLKKFWIFFTLLVLAGIFSNYASAQIIDDVVLNTVKGKVVITIRLAGPVQYLRHFPTQKGQMLEIYYNILSSDSARDQWQGYEARTSPPSDLIPSFTVTARDLNTQPKLVIQFSRAVEFSVRGGKSNRSILVVVQPENAPPGAKEELPELPEIEQEGPESGDIPPSAAATAPARQTKKANKQATALMLEGRDAMLLFDYAAAIAAFNKILQLPPNKYTADAQEWMGVANENIGRADEAKLAYEMYLKRYTRGAGATRVKDRLARLTAIQSTPAAQAITRPQAQESPEAGNLPLSAATPIPSVGQFKETDKQAAALMEKGRDALQLDDYGAAIKAFNQLLQLPPNQYTQDAQEWVGVSRERADQKFKAKLEYELYLKTYTSGKGVERVKERLAKLSAIQPVQTAGKPEQPKEKKGFQTVTYGNLSMYYYHGASQTDTITIAGNTPTPSRLTVVDQSLLLTNVSLGIRARNDVYDNRLVFQDSYSKNFLAGKTSNNRLNAAYYDLKNKVDDYSGRIGRQSPLGGGVIGRFDGATVGYGFLPKWRANGVAGRIADLSVGSKPVFYGASLDMGTFNNRWGGSVYTIKQTVDRITDRRAEGAEVRYFDANKNAFATLDYDSHFSVVNTALLQGTITGAPGTSYNFLLDHRRTPSISTRNALNGASVSSVNNLLQAGLTEADLKGLATARTAIANLAQIGVSRQIKEKWLLGGDLRVSSTTSMSASGRDPTNLILCPLGPTSCPEGFQPATTATGNAWTLTSQLIGNSIFSSLDVSVFSLGYTTSNTLRGVTFFVSNRSIVRDKWTADTSLRLYAQNDDLGGKETIVTPTLKLSYQAKERLSLETEIGLEKTDNTPATGQPVKTNRKYFSLGFRGDF